MYPLHDNDLDRLSREASENFEVEPGASGWEHLEKRLDQELPQKKKRRRFLFWLFFITATTGGALAYIITYKPVNPLGKNGVSMVSSAQKPAVGQQQEDNTAANEEVQNKPATGNAATPATPDQTTINPAPVVNNQGVGTSSPVPSTTTNPKSNTVGATKPAPATLATTPGKSNAQINTKTGNAQRSTPASRELADRSPLSLNYATITPGNKDKNAGHTTKPFSNKQGKRLRNKAGQQKQTVNPAPDNTIATDAAITAKEQQQTIAEPVAVEPATSAQAAAIAADSAKNKAVGPSVTDSANTLVKETPKKEDPKKDKNEKGFELGLIAGPDVSTVKFGPLYKAGYNFGLQVGYRFSNRWSVNTGIIYTKKYYQADGDDFHYKNPWVPKYDKAEGNCSMWEIPVNVRYDLSFNTKRRWFASTGLSTYLMDKEYYDLYYTWNGTQSSYPMPSDSNTNYFFSILNLSFGMERSLGKHFSIQAEPYLKVPLQGLGKGSIRMDSYGIYFTLKFKPGFCTKK